MYKFLFMAALLLPQVCLASDWRDPTKPFEVRSAIKKERDAFRLQSVLIGDKRKTAMINNKAVEVGDWIGGAQVMEITSNRVAINKAGKRQILTLNAPIKVRR